MKSRIKDILTFLIGWPLSLVALYFVIKTFLPKFSDIRSLITNLNPFLLIIGFFCFLMYYFLRSIIWQSVLSEHKYSIPYRKTGYLWASAELKRYVPGNIWSFLSKTVSFTNEGVSKSHLAKSMLSELQFILMGALIVSILSLPFLNKYLFPELKSVPFLNLLIISLAIILVILFIFHNSLLKLLKGKLRQILGFVFPDYTPLVTFKFLFISILAFLFFGAGYYFSISSIVYLDVKLILTLSGFFVFSLLVGLLSFITPTGLGVREGMVTLGLSKLLPISVAGFASIFTRLILITSEITFVTLTLIYSKINSKFSQKLEKFVKTKKYKLVLLFGIIVFNLYFIPVSFLRHDNFYTGRFDLGNMDQTVWNTKNGRIFEFTNPDNTQNISRLAFHADFILVPLSLFYFIWEDPKMLLLIQSVVVSLGAIFIYLLTLNVLKRRYSLHATSYTLIALAISFSYLMNPSLQWSILYDFHAVTLATTFLIAAFYFMYAKKYFLFIFFGLLAGITKEQVWIPVGLMGLYLCILNIKDNISKIKIKNYRLLLNKQTILGLFIFAFSVLIFYLLMWHAIPNSSSDNQHFAVSYFNNESSGTSGLIGSFLSNPSEILNKLSSKSRINYFKFTFGPLGYLPLLAPWFLLFPIADFSLNILGDKPELHQIYYQYSAIITPFMYIGAIFGICYILRYLKNHSITIFIAIYIVLLALWGGYIYGPLPWTKKPNIAMLKSPQENKNFIYEKLKSIPNNYKVSSTNNLGAHLTHREDVYTIPHGTTSADMIIFLIRPGSPNYEKDLVSKLRSDPNYSIETDKNGFIIFERSNVN